ncbi:MAG TPA: hypothetical protein VFL55_15385, partial [Acetobacteraceae bacterium]|nr:hypothetical protein [Acetobacteraceae bacterium]
PLPCAAGARQGVPHHEASLGSRDPMTTLVPLPEDEAGKRAWAIRQLRQRDDWLGAVSGEAILHTAA